METGFAGLHPPPAFACFASYGSASQTELYRSEASEGCRGVARRAKPGSIRNAHSRATARQAKPNSIVAKQAKAAAA